MSNILESRNHTKAVHGFVSPWVELNAGLWSLFGGATIFLILRIWCKVTRRYGLWYDDYILLVSWVVLLANNTLIVWQFGNGYVLKDSTLKWDEHMRILINISSCGTLIGQAWTKTAFGVTLLRMTTKKQQWVLWFCIVSMNLFMFVKILFQWAQICDKDGYQQYWRLNFCINWRVREEFKEGGNVYNIIMDFVFAMFPWLITRKLEMRRAEKIGLCATMSLGMIVAIVSAIRVGWKDEGNDRDEYYFFRNGVSQVWYSSEIAGTIIVQCIPILRPILREFTTSLTSRKLHSTDNRQSTSWVGKHSKRGSTGTANNAPVAKPNIGIALREIPEEEIESWKRPQSSSTETSGSDRKLRSVSPTSPFENRWENEKHSPRQNTFQRSGRSLELERGPTSHSFISYDPDLESQQGLSPPPRRIP